MEFQLVSETESEALSTSIFLQPIRLKGRVVEQEEQEEQHVYSTYSGTNVWVVGE
jgi:hypothetical protein